MATFGALSESGIWAFKFTKHSLDLQKHRIVEFGRDF